MNRDGEGILGRESWRNKRTAKPTEDEAKAFTILRLSLGQSRCRVATISGVGCLAALIPEALYQRLRHHFISPDRVFVTYFLCLHRQNTPARCAAIQLPPGMSMLLF